MLGGKQTYFLASATEISSKTCQEISICIPDLTSETWNGKTKVRLVRDALSKSWITGLLWRLIISIHFKVHQWLSMAFACFTARDSHVMYDTRKYSNGVGCVLIAHVAVTVNVWREHAPVRIKVFFTAASVLEKRYLQLNQWVKQWLIQNPLTAFCFLWELSEFEWLESIRFV